MSCHKHIIPKWNARRSVLHSPKTRLCLYYLSMFNSWSACHHHGWNTTVTNTRHFNDLFNTNHHDKRTQRWAPFHPWNRATYSDARQKSRSYIVTIERRRWVANNVDLYMYMVYLHTFSDVKERSALSNKFKYFLSHVTVICSAWWPSQPVQWLDETSW